MIAVARRNRGQDHPGRALALCEIAATRALAALHQLDQHVVTKDQRVTEACMATLIADLERIVDLARGHIKP